MAVIDTGLVRGTQCPDAVKGETWIQAVDHLRDIGFSIPRLKTSSGDVCDDAENRTDPPDRFATVEILRAWDAAGRVTPDELEVNLGLATTDDGEAWLAPNGDCIGDVVRAVAFDTGRIEAPDDELAECSIVYNRAREEYGAPVPRYYTTADAIAEFDAVLDVIGEVTFFDIDSDVLNSEVSAEGDEVSGNAVRTINPAWRESESGE